MSDWVNPSLEDLAAELEQELAEAFGVDRWEDVPHIVQNNFRTPNVNLEKYLEHYGSDSFEE